MSSYKCFTFWARSCKSEVKFYGNQLESKNALLNVYMKYILLKIFKKRSWSTCTLSREVSNIKLYIDKVCRRSLQVQLLWYPCRNVNERNELQKERLKLKWYGYWWGIITMNTWSSKSKSLEHFAFQSSSFGTLPLWPMSFFKTHFIRNGPCAWIVLSFPGLGRKVETKLAMVQIFLFSAL